MSNKTCKDCGKTFEYAHYINDSQRCAGCQALHDAEIIDPKLQVMMDEAKARTAEAELELAKIDADPIKVKQAKWQSIGLVIGPWFGHSLVWAIATIAVAYIIAVLRK